METPNLGIFAERMKTAKTDVERQLISQEASMIMQNYLNFDNGKSKETKLDEMLSQIEQGIDELHNFVANPKSENSSYLKAA